MSDLSNIIMPKVCKQPIKAANNVKNINSRCDQTALLSSYIIELRRVTLRTKLLRNQQIRRLKAHPIRRWCQYRVNLSKLTLCKNRVKKLKNDQLS